MAVLSYDVVVTALQVYEGEETSLEAVQYKNSIANDTVVLPSGVSVRAPEALLYYNKLADRKTIRDAAEELPARKLTIDSVKVAVRPPTISTTASDILTDLQAFADESSPECATYKNLLGGTTVTMFDLYYKEIEVRAADMLRYAAKGMTVTDMGAAYSESGTAVSGGCGEADIVSGGQTIIYELEAGTWAAAGTAFNALRAAFLAILRSDEDEDHGWNVEVVAALTVSDVVRTSDTVVTITLPAVAAYAIDSEENISIGAPPNSIVTPEGGTLRVGSAGFGVANVFNIATA